MRVIELVNKYAEGYSQADFDEMRQIVTMARYQKQLPIDEALLINATYKAWVENPAQKRGVRQVRDTSGCSCQGVKYKNEYFATEEDMEEKYSTFIALMKPHIDAYLEAVQTKTEHVD